MSDRLSRDPLAPAVAALCVESNHRIANNLAIVASFLSLQASRISQSTDLISPVEVRSILMQASAKVVAAGELHRLLTAAGEDPVNLRDYLTKVAEGAVEAMTDGEQIELLLEFDPACAVQPEVSLNLGFMVGELIINAVKHAHPAHFVKGKIEVGCAYEGNDMVVWIADDGVGLPDGFDQERDGGLGMRTLRLMARQSQAQLRFVNSELGLTVQIRVPNVIDSSREAQVA